jgi:recombination protein RecT
VSDSNAANAVENKTEAAATASAPAVKAAASVAVAQKKKPTLRDHLEGAAFKDAVAKALPRHLPPDRFLRVAITAMTRTPKLAECEPASFFNALLTLSQFGLEPDGRRAHLIPYENRKRGVLECQLILDWKGIAELVMRSGVVANLHADVIREGDLFDYSAGQLKAHVPHFLRRDAAKPKDAGDLFAVYSLANFKDGTAKCEVLSMDEVEGIRRRSRAGNAGPWVTDFNEMAKKTAFRRLSKWLPLSSEIRDALDGDEDRLEERAADAAKRVGPVGSMADALGDMPPMALPSEAEGGAE